jgi:DNA primase
MAEVSSGDRLRRLGSPPSSWREGTLALTGINHPELIERQQEAFVALNLENPDLDQLLGFARAAILADPGLDSTGLKRHLQTTKAAETLERVLRDDTLNRQRFLRTEAEMGEVEWGWSNALRHHLVATDARRELQESASQSFTIGDDVWKAAVTAREELINSDSDDRRESGDSDVTNKEFLERLEQLRSSVKTKAKR